MMRKSTVFFGLSALIFLLFAFWQWNDPDPEIWVSIYVFAAVMSALAAFGRYSVLLLVTAAVAALLGALYYFPSSVGDWISQEWQQADLSMKTMDMEEARESFGLLIVSVILGIEAWVGWRRNRS